MNKEKTININLSIADRSYPLKIKPEEEEAVRKAAKSINDKIKEYHDTFGKQDKVDYLAMVALWFAVELQKQNSSPSSLNGLSDSIEKIELQLKSVLG